MYKLEIISTTNNKPYIQHKLDREVIIGCFENEPFSLKFTNTNWNPVQIRIIVDGIDILTGSLAITEAEGIMFYVPGMQNIELKAWPNDNMGGSEFLFGRVSNSVAKNTHVNIGIIKVQIFEEESKSREYYTNILRSRPELGICAGNRVEQKLIEVDGLGGIFLKEEIEIKYDDWSHLHSRLRCNGKEVGIISKAKRKNTLYARF